MKMEVKHTTLMITITAALYMRQLRSNGTKLQLHGGKPLDLYPQQRNRTTSTRSRCERITVPQCNGLIDYTHARLPNRFNHMSQQSVYWALQPWWPILDWGCSDNLRTLVCGLHLPRCTPASPDEPPHLPCRRTCRKAKVRCLDLVKRNGLKWMLEMDCRTLPRGKSMVPCIPAKRETSKKNRRKISRCQPNELSMCQNLPFSRISLPNPFMQSDISVIARELRQYHTLVSTQCSRHLRFMLCGAFLPICISNGQPYTVPCRELCQEVYRDCHSDLRRQWKGLPWPAKLQCHRYPSAMDNDGTGNNNNSQGHRGQEVQSSYSYGDNTGVVPCTMAPILT